MRHFDPNGPQVGGAIWRFTKASGATKAIDFDDHALDEFYADYELAWAELQIAPLALAELPHLIQGLLDRQGATLH